MNKHHKLVVVEDNPADLQLFKLALKKTHSQHSLMAFTSGQSLIDYLEKASSDDVAGIILDLNMPQYDGRKMIAVLRANPEWCDVPIVIFTSSAQESEIIACYELGISAFVTKPIELEVFEYTINAMTKFLSCQRNLMNSNEGTFAA